MTQEALKLALEALELEEAQTHYPPQWLLRAITAIKEALAQTQEPVAVYGYCPQCGAKGVMRERRPNGNDKCANGHTYPSSTSTPPQSTEQEPVAWVAEAVCDGQYIDGRPRKIWWECKKGVGTAFYTTPPQRTWVGLTDEEENEYNYLGPDMHWVIQEIAAKLKELNT